MLFRVTQHLFLDQFYIKIIVVNIKFTVETGGNTWMAFVLSAIDITTAV